MPTAVAYAKINLALHVRRRRDDGNHEIETLFAFLDDGDRLSMSPAEVFTLTQTGPFGGKAGPSASNLVTRAARLAGRGELPPVCITLDKQLPVAAGLGGGSADAAATLRMLGEADDLDLAPMLGADVPACMASVPTVGTGTGTRLSPITNDVRGLACLIVNPVVPLPTGPVFARWDGIDRGPIPVGSARDVMFGGRNDLEAPAIAICPVIADLLATLNETNPLLARMSGSGASCFALYESYDEASAHELAIHRDRHHWWTMLGRLR